MFYSICRDMNINVFNHVHNIDLSDRQVHICFTMMWSYALKSKRRNQISFEEVQIVNTTTHSCISIHTVYMRRDLCIHTLHICVNGCIHVCVCLCVCMYVCEQQEMRAVVMVNHQECFYILGHRDATIAHKLVAIIPLLAV